MCRVLELTRGGFYQWIHKPLSIAGKESRDTAVDSINGARQAHGQRQQPKPETTSAPLARTVRELVEAESVETMTSKPAEIVEQSPILTALADF